MRKVILIALCALVTGGAAMAQFNNDEGFNNDEVVESSDYLTNAEISAIINRSKSLNETINGITNPDVVEEGDIVTFLYEDGHTNDFMVEKGGHQWQIVRKAGGLQEKHGQIVDVVEEVVADEVAANTTPPTDRVVESTEKLSASTLIFGMDPYNFGLLVLFVLFGLVALFGIYHLVKSGKAKKWGNYFRYGQHVYSPTTGGTPVVNGGIQDEGHARNVIQDRVVRQYNAAHLNNPITRDQTSFTRGRQGKVYSDGRPVTIEYWNNTSATRILDGEDAWEGTVRNLRTDEETTVVALEACGNAVTSDLEGVRFEAATEQPTTITQSDAELEAATAEQAQAEAQEMQVARMANLDLSQVVDGLVANGGKLTMSSDGNGNTKINVRLKRSKSQSDANAGTEVVPVVKAKATA